ncbi:MAG TPA: hypothetical protein VNM48_05490 [Chloroflexota bacterium]|nr:hypothetical protein [Chloroflexota bacterium]
MNSPHRTDSPSSPSEAAGALRDVLRTRRAVRAAVSPFWLPLVLFGAITLGSALVAARQLDSLGTYWMVTGPSGGVICGLWYAVLGHRRATSASATPFILTAIVLTATATVAGTLLDGGLAWVLPGMAVGAGYLVFAWLTASRTVGACAVAISALPLLAQVALEPSLGAQAAGVAGIVASGGFQLGAGIAVVADRPLAPTQEDAWTS